jgi:hypothetical protein
MSKQQLGLHGSKKRQDDVRLLLIEACLDGKKTLAQAMGITDRTIAELRAQAYVLYRTGKWERCIDVVLGLVSLGSLEPWDPVILSRCYDEIDDPDHSAICAKIAQVMLSELDAAIRAQEREPS